MPTTVKEVMNSEVALVNGSTPFKDVAEVLIVYGVSTVSVVDAESPVLGVVSEADLLCKEEFRERSCAQGSMPLCAPATACPRKAPTPNARPPGTLPSG
ncbi:CBS domain-containing protein [Nonomuraea jabiensis]|uniref:CBS domain-containing protein n=1 Tax=Nonomuraea jabiensis TaxID=882448 RepID=UPI003D73B0EA